jgi:hypothetical protein
MKNMYDNRKQNNKDLAYQNNNNILSSIFLLLSDLKNNEQNQFSQTKLDQVILECKLTDIIQKILDVCNPILKNFKLTLEME